MCLYGSYIPVLSQLPAQISKQWHFFQQDEAVDEKAAEFLPAEVVTGLASSNWKERLAAVEKFMEVIAVYILCDLLQCQERTFMAVTMSMDSDAHQVAARPLRCRPHLANNCLPDCCIAHIICKHCLYPFADHHRLCLYQYHSISKQAIQLFWIIVRSFPGSCYVFLVICAVIAIYTRV